jgi:outer membrane protein assembly factor BamE (lipoprotein component of BamABCDE complex)
MARTSDLFRLRTGFCLAVMAVWITAGCTTKSTVLTRKKERAGIYAGLAADDQALIDQGQIKVGMSPDAVYIAWGTPAQVLESDAGDGHVTTWLYQGNTTDEYLFWNFREVPRRDGTVFLDRFLDRTYDFRSYVSAELIFRDGRLASWRTLPKPPSSTRFNQF